MFSDITFKWVQDHMSEIVKKRTSSPGRLMCLISRWQNTSSSRSAPHIMIDFHLKQLRTANWQATSNFTAIKSLRRKQCTNSYVPIRRYQCLDTYTIRWLLEDITSMYVNRVFKRLLLKYYKWL